jgi:DNA repair photolyase
MRAFILAGLVVCLLAQPALAESTAEEAYNTFRAEQEADYEAVLDLDEAIWKIVSKYDYFEDVPKAEQGLLEKNAQETLSIVEQMRTRGKTAFETIEGQYELYCLEGSLYLLLWCDKPMQYYKLIIVDTIVHGGMYPGLTEYSNYILSSLDRE